MSFAVALNLKLTETCAMVFQAAKTLSPINFQFLKQDIEMK